MCLPLCRPLKAMGSKKRAVKAKCANMQKAREVVAQRRAAEAAGPREVEAQAEAIAAEAEAQADAGADEADAQLHQLQADPQHSEQQLAHNQRMQHLQQQLQDLQRSELQRKEQQLADLEAQQRAALLQWEQQLIERQHQLEQQQADLSRREQDLTERQHQLQQQQADLDSREQQQARIQTLPQQLHSLQQELKAQQVAEVQRVVQQQLASTTALVQVIECLLQGRRPLDGVGDGRDDGEGWVGKMDMRQLCLWSDGCASQFKGAKAIRLHWHLANRFGVPVQWSYGATSHFKSTHDSEGGVAKKEWREQMLVHPELVGKVCGAAVLTDWANKHFAVPCHAQDTSASHRQRGHIMRRSYLVLDDARQTTICSMPEADVERMHKDVKGCRAMHRMVFTPDGDQPQWAMAGCACSTCMSVPCLPCMKPDTTTPLEPMPMFQDTVKEVREDEECYALLMLFHSDLLHDEVCFGKLTNKHCERYRMHMGWERQDGRRELRRLVRRELLSEELEAEYEADNGCGSV
ncbi:hypothetical protein QJQ45_009633 [Haematococcus lacustris]|nr:hypothetical protein QJQ45_009633 [Haematococcus lacustris]